jgi:hypothetical protein
MKWLKNSSVFLMMELFFLKEKFGCLLRHSLFNTHAKRLGKVIKVTPTHIEFWEVGRSGKVKVEW